MVTRSLFFYLGSLCFLLACVLPAYYLFTGDYSPDEKVPAWADFFIFILQFPIIPIGLLFWVLAFWKAGLRPSQLAAITGFALGMWLTTVALALPYFGIYPNIVPAFIVLLINYVSGIDQSDPRFTFAVIFIVNLVLYPFLCWFTVRLACPLGPKSPVWERNAAGEPSARDSALLDSKSGP